MSDPGPSLRSVLEDLQLTRKDDVDISAAFRAQLEKSELLENMQRISDLVNTEAGTLVIDVQSYLSPEVIVRSFTFKKGQDEYVCR
jgi:hypothetical protein